MNTPNRSTVRRRLFDAVLPLAVAAAALAAAALLQTPEGRPVSTWFLTWDNARFAAAQGIVTGLGALGMALVILSGGVDLSAGAAALLSGIVTALAFQSGASAPAAVGAGVLAGAAAGLLNGTLAALFRAPPWALTLGTLVAARAVALWISGETPLPLPDGAGGLAAWVGPLPHARWMPLAPGVWMVFLAAGMFAVLWRCSIVGRHAAALGSSELAARACGVRVGWTKMAIYTLAGCCFGLAGVAQSAATGQAVPVAGGVSLALAWIAAAVLGGVRLGGGAGSLWGALCGAAALTLLQNALQQAGWPVPLQQILLGVLLVAAVALDRVRHEARSGPTA